MKIRLYRGPFDGKVMKDWPGGAVIMTGPKKMNRRQRYEWFANHPYEVAPHVRAIYEQVFIRTAQGTVPAMHPDGSFFYEYRK